MPPSMTLIAAHSHSGYNTETIFGLRRDRRSTEPVAIVNVFAELQF
jgi:hypothetical protein